jgi:hypothetical protein
MVVTILICVAFILITVADDICYFRLLNRVKELEEEVKWLRSK